MSRLTIFVFMFCFLGQLALTPSDVFAQQKRAADLVSIDAKQQKLSVVCDQLSKTSGVQIQVSPGVDQELTLSLKDVPVLTAVRVLAVCAGAVFKTPAKGVLRLERPGLRYFRARSLPAHQVFKMLMALRGQSVVVDSSLTQLWTIDAHSLPWEELLRDLLFANRAQRIKDRVVTVLKSPQHQIARYQRRLGQLTKLIKAAARHGTGDNAKLLNIDVVNISLERVCTVFERKTGFAVTCQPGLAKTITLFLRQTPAREAMRICAERAKIDLVELSPGRYHFCKQLRVSDQRNHVSIRELLNSWATKLKKSLDMPESFQGRVCLSLDKVTYAAAIRAVVASQHGYTVTENESTIVVAKTTGNPSKAKKMDSVKDNVEPRKHFTPGLQAFLTATNQPPGASAEAQEQFKALLFKYREHDLGVHFEALVKAFPWSAAKRQNKVNESIKKNFARLQSLHFEQLLEESLKNGQGPVIEALGARIRRCLLWLQQGPKSQADDAHQKRLESLSRDQRVAASNVKKARALTVDLRAVASMPSGLHQTAKTLAWIDFHLHSAPKSTGRPIIVNKQKVFLTRVSQNGLELRLGRYCFERRFMISKPTKVARK